jgi:hypothetical protein
VGAYLITEGELGQNSLPALDGGIHQVSDTTFTAYGGWQSVSIAYRSTG